jgi:hypothetical protein
MKNEWPDTKPRHPSGVILGTLSSELGAHAERLSPRPRIYVDANVPAPLVEHMRRSLDWDVLWVIEEAELRRASDVRHYRLARQLRRTLVTMDRDYLDDKRFPPAEGGGVLVIQAPNERELCALMDRVDRALFPRADAASDSADTAALPLVGKKLHVQTDWGRDGRYGAR